MARQFKIEVDYEVGITAELYWHDNDTVEFVSLPQTVDTASLVNRGAILERVIAYFKTAKVTSLQINRLP